MPSGERPPDEEGEEQGRIRVTGPGPLVVSGVVGLVGGWALRPVSLRMGYVEPQVPVASVLLLLFVAAIVGGSAYLTRRVVHRDRQRLAPHQAVNRLVLGKAVALAGAVIAGGYLGYAVAQLGVADPSADQRLWRSLAAGVAGIACTAAALALEHACRVPPGDE